MISLFINKNAFLLHLLASFNDRRWHISSSRTIFFPYPNSTYWKRSLRYESTKGGFISYIGNVSRQYLDEVGFQWIYSQYSAKDDNHILFLQCWCSDWKGDQTFRRWTFRRWTLRHQEISPLGHFAANTFILFKDPKSRITNFCTDKSLNAWVWKTPIKIYLSIFIQI